MFPHLDNDSFTLKKHSFKKLIAIFSFVLFSDKSALYLIIIKKFFEDDLFSSFLFFINSIYFCIIGFNFLFSSFSEIFFRLKKCFDKFSFLL